MNATKTLALREANLWLQHVACVDNFVVCLELIVS